MKKKLKPVLILLFALTSFSVHAQTWEESLKKTGITLPPLGKPQYNYVDAIRVGNLLYLSGKGPLQENGKFITGKVGKDLTVEQGYEAAKLTAMSSLAVLAKAVKEMKNIKRIVKVTGYVNCTEGFPDASKVLDGYSDLIVKLFGEKGEHARTAVGVAGLPFNIAVEVEMIVELEDSN